MGRRTYSREFKISAVGLVQQQGYTVVQAARSLGVDPSSLRGWLKQYPVEGAATPDGAEPSRPNCGGCVRRTSGSPWSARF